MGHLRGTATLSGPVLVVMGTRSPAQEAVATYGAPPGDGSPSGPGLTDGGTGSHAHKAVGAYGVPPGDGKPKRPGLHGWRDGESCP